MHANPQGAAAARVLLSQVRESLERAESSPWRWIGIDRLKDEGWLKGYAIVGTGRSTDFLIKILR